MKHTWHQRSSSWDRDSPGECQDSSPLHTEPGRKEDARAPSSVSAGLPTLTLSAHRERSLVFVLASRDLYLSQVPSKCQLELSHFLGGANYIQLVLWQDIHPVGAALLTDNQGLTPAWGQGQAANKAGSWKAQDQAWPLKKHPSRTARAGSGKMVTWRAGLKRSIPSSDSDTEGWPY